MSGLHILFHAPLKPPGHPVPSGDRTMGRSFLRILEKAGHRVSVASDLRTYLSGPEALDGLKRQARDEVSRLIKTYSHPKVRPDLWLTYHNYYRAPDLVGPDCAQSLGIPYVLAEASHAAKRAKGEWAVAHRAAEHATQRADAHLCLTPVDRAGLADVVSPERSFDFPPFIDVSAFNGQSAKADRTDDLRLISVGMMRARAKRESYEAIAAALPQLPATGWHLQIVGDGPERAEVEALFAPFGTRVTFLGELSHGDVVAALNGADAFLWPGRREAYGLVYLEAQAAGLPVIAEAYKAHRAVMQPDVTALVTPVDQPHALAVSIRMIMQDRALARRMGQAARSFVLDGRSDAAAIPRFSQVLAALNASRKKTPPVVMSRSSGTWTETVAALKEIEATGKQARFWLRDDDAVVPTEALDRLLAMSGQADVPLVIASIPAYATPALADMVREFGRVMVAPHGFSHTDHGGAGEKRSEFPSGRSGQDAAEEIALGWRRISELFGEQALPLFVPPWNRMSAEHLPALSAAGLAGLSGFGWSGSESVNDLILRPTHLDIMQWGARRHGRPLEDVDAEMASHIRHQAALPSPEPIGLLTHHLAHDETAWGVLGSLLSLLSEHDAASFPASA